MHLAPLIIIIISWVLVVRLPRACPSCLKYTFIKTDFERYTVGNIYGPTQEPVAVERCAKICRLLSDCLGFNMEWTEKTQGIGYCEAFGPVESGNEQQPSDNYTMYAVCPDALSYYPTVGHCYSLVRLRLAWTKARDFCYNLYPGAHLMDVQSEAEQIIATSLSAGVKKVWLGGRRAEGGGQYDITWIQRNRNVYYDFTNWHRKEPSITNPSKPSDCISIKYGNLWYDNTCNKAYYFLCEY